MAKHPLHEQRNLMGLVPRFQFEALEDTTHPDSPEDDQDLQATPKSDDSEPPDTTGQGASDYWDMYRALEDKARQLAKSTMEMQEQLSQVTEGALTNEQRKFLKNAQRALGSAVAAQKEAYRKIAEFGSTMLG